MNQLTSAGRHADLLVRSNVGNPKSLPGYLEMVKVSQNRHRGRSATGADWIVRAPSTLRLFLIAIFLTVVMETRAATTDGAPGSPHAPTSYRHFRHRPGGHHVPRGSANAPG